MILWNVWGYNHDPDVWNSPSQFCPERYNVEFLQIIIFSFLQWYLFLFLIFRFMNAKHELHNFGAGPRMCVGLSLGEEEVYLKICPFSL